MLPTRLRQDWALAGFLFLLVAAFVLGGSPRPEVVSLLVLRPLAVVLLAFGLLLVRASTLRAHRFLLIMAALIAALPLLQVVPLPQVVAQALPGHEIVNEIARLKGSADGARTLSVDPADTWNAFYAALVPLALLVLGVQLNNRQLRQALCLVLAACVISAVLGIVQMQSSRDSLLYFYAITNFGAPVGLFANRNHNALFLAAGLCCLLPLLASRLGHSPGGRVVLCAVIIVQVLCILATGSRAGAAALVIALAALLVAIARRSASRGSRSRSWLVSGAVLSALLFAVALAQHYGRVPGLTRLRDTQVAQELRFQIFPTIGHQVAAFWPFGSGLGTFRQVYLSAEPDILLSPVTMNHAHNDWAELALTGGLPAVLLMGAGTFAYLLSAARLAARARRRGTIDQHAIAGLVIILQIGLASWFDYPLRVPSISCLLVVAALWISRGLRSSGTGLACARSGCNGEVR